jgi:uncharacterized delta-60 repeat protein
MFTQFKRFMFNAWLLGTLISLLTVTIALAASGDLDTTFSGDGLVTSYAAPSNPSRWDIAVDVAIQSDPQGKPLKIIAAGWSRLDSTGAQDFALIRYKPNGSLDSTFSGDGRLITNFGGRDSAYAVAVQSNGKIVAAGHTCDNNGNNCNIALARYKAGGGLDITFSGDGKQITDFGGGDNGSYGGLAIQKDGKIVVAGWTWNGQNYDFAVYRYNATCPDDAHCLDTTFSGDGKLNIGFGAGRQDFANDLAIQDSDGKIVISGYTGDANRLNNNFAIARLNPNGTLDNSFGQLLPNGKRTGRRTTDFGADEYAYGFGGQIDGRIVLVGRKITATGNFFAIARYKQNGSLDTTFNGTGKKAFSVGPGTGTWQSWASDVIVQPADNKIVVLGLTSDFASIFDIALVRLHPEGTFDTGFGEAGKVFIDFGGDDYAYNLTRQRLDGKYVLVGNTNAGIGGIDFALGRVLP